jgi:hypothetical protein
MAGTERLLSLIHATRGRPAQALAARAVWLERAEEPERIEHLFVFDEEDEISRQTFSTFPHVMVSPGGSSVRAWNAGAEVSTGQVLVQLSDDWVPPSGWDRKILEALGPLSEPKVLAVSDGHRRDRLLCLAILTRARYGQQGWMFYPGYQSVWSDNEFTHRAYADQVVVEARDLIFEHRHPLFDAAVPMDPTYRHQNRKDFYEEGRRIFLERNPEAELPAAQGHRAQGKDPRLAFLRERLSRSRSV